MLPGHSSLLHSSHSSFADPEQTSPPLAGVGLLQGLFLLRLPPPHVTEQVDHVVHSPHPPCTKIKQLHQTFYNLFHLIVSG